MSETGSQRKSTTRMTSGIADGQTRAGFVTISRCANTSGPPRVMGDFVVRIPKDQKSIAVKINTRLMAEQREIERANDAIRRSGK
jgi:hypothetical protein